jgi:uncharacterized protein (TIGR03437 family)
MILTAGPTAKTRRMMKLDPLQPVREPKREVNQRLGKALQASVCVFWLFEVLALCGGLVQAQSILFVNNAVSQPYPAPIAIGPKGIFMAAASYDPGSLAGAAGSHATLLNFDSSGKRVWAQQVAEPTGVFPKAIAADSTAVYVTGSTGVVELNAFIRKYDDGGKELWFRQFPVGSAHRNQTAATGVGSDASGVYITASDSSYGLQPGLAEGLLRKYSPAGNEMWSRALNGSSPSGLAIDAAGIYVIGLNAGGGYLSRYTLDGDEVWRHQFDPSPLPGTSLHIPLAVVADSTGIYVGGGMGQRLGEGVFEPSRPFVPGRFDDAFLLKLNADGRELWAHDLGGTKGRVNAIGIDASGVYAAGATSSSLPGQCKAGSVDPFVAKFDSAGSELWTRQFGTPLTEAVAGVAVDSSGVYIGGGAFGPGGTGGDTFLAKMTIIRGPVSDSRPHITPDCVLNAANYTGGGVAPGEIVTIYGGAMGPSTTTASNKEDGRFATTLAGVRILFDGTAAPLLYVSVTQSSAVVPYSVSGKETVTVQVEYQGVISDPLVVPVFPVRAAVFTKDGSGRGQGLILNEDGSLNSPDNPGQRGTVFTMFMTGVGLATPPVSDGAIVGSTVPKPRAPVVVSFADPSDSYGDQFLQAEIISSAGIPGAVNGLFELQFRVPPATLTGSAVPITFWQNGQIDQVLYGDNAVTLALR